jgi:class 3 adenylate cyclase
MTARRHQTRKPRNQANLTTIPASILFADVVGFSKLNTSEINKYVLHVLPKLRSHIKEHKEGILSINTWGDGLFILSKDALKLAELALAIRDYFRNNDFRDDGLPPLKIRIALHHAQVMQFPNLLRSTDFDTRPKFEYIGTQVNLASRVEPVTPPNHIWTTNIFKDVLIGPGSDGPTHLGFEDIGSYPLAKNAGEIPIFHLHRKQGDLESPRPAPSISVKALAEAGNRYQDRFKRLEQCRQGEEVRLIAITARGALLPHNAEGFSNLPVPSAIKRGVKLKVIVLEPNCPEAIFRSGIESGSETPLSDRLLQRDAYDVEKMLLPTYTTHLGLSVEEMKARLKIGRTTIGIGFSLWLFSNVAFMEPHHYGKENESVNLCRFAASTIHSGNREYNLLDIHFQALWDAQETKKLW